MNAERRDQAESVGAEPIRLRGSNPPVLRPEEFANLLRQKQEGGKHSSSTVNSRDLQSAMDMVHEAASVIRATDSQIDAIEERARSLLAHAATEMKAINARAEAAVSRATDLEAKVRDAETRADELEHWLREVVSTINEELPSRS